MAWCVRVCACAQGGAAAPSEKARKQTDHCEYPNFRLAESIACSPRDVSGRLCSRTPPLPNLGASCQRSACPDTWHVACGMWHVSRDGRTRLR